MERDNLHKPIEWICATYSFDGLKALLPYLNEACNIASVADELHMRTLSEVELED